MILLVFNNTVKMSNLHIPKIKSFTKEENQILQSIIKSKDKIVVMNMCGRGDKDIFTIADELNIKI